jgi:tight adherence protein C
MTPIIPVALAAAGAASVFLLAWSLIPKRSSLTRRIDQLAKIPTRSLSARNLIIEQIVSKEHTSKLQQRLLEAGWYHVSAAAMTMRAIGALGLGLAIGLVLVLTLGNHLLGWVLGGLAAVLTWRMPYIVMGRAIKARREGVSRSLPDYLDLLSSSVAAGLSLNAAMIQSVQAVEGPLRQELDSCLSEIRLGRSRAEAFISMADRVNEPQTTTMATALVQAEKLGSNVVQVLQELAKDTRERRWLMAEERAARLPILMLIPMALFMMPSLYLMIFGPVAAYMMQPH